MTHPFDEAGFTTEEVAFIGRVFATAGRIAERGDPATAREAILAGMQTGMVAWTQPKLAAMREVITQARFERVVEEGMEDG